MDTKELNDYLKNYLENDISHRAVMLTAEWGSGKTYYVKNVLMKYLVNKCVYVSLYGISSIEELNKELFLEIKLKKSQHPKLFKAKKKAEFIGSAVIGLGKTIIKNLCHVNLDIDWRNQNFEKLYSEVNLKDKLIIFDDLERSKINIIELLGYINNLEEHDGIKLLIIANEQAILKYRNVEKDGKSIRELSEESLEYLNIKEKTISDTINFYCDLRTSVTQIINLFYEKDKTELFQKIINLDGNNATIEKIVDVMHLVNKNNLRSIIYACQKTVDLFNKFTKSYDLKFLQDVFLGTLAYCLKNNQNENFWWQTKELTSTELGIGPFPMYKFAFDFINYQYFEEINVVYVQQLFEIAKKQEEANEDLQVLYSYSSQTEKSVRNSIKNIVDQLKNEDIIPYSEYLKIINYLISARSILNNNKQVEEAKNLMYNNIKNGKLNKKIIKLGQISGVQLYKEEEKEFDEYKKSLYDLLDVVEYEKSGEFDIESFYNDVLSNHSKFINKRSFMDSFSLDCLVNSLKNANAKQIMEVRSSFLDVYSSINIREFLGKDIVKLKQLKEELCKLQNFENYDRIQKQQIKWFIGNLEEIIKNLQGDKDV